MTANKAREFLLLHFECLKEMWKPHPDYNVLESIKFAIWTTEKQIPKKPIKKERSGMGYDYEDYYCSCGKFIGYEPQVNEILKNGKIPFKYCPNCGQALDWENT